jgi:hypothetical protein
LNVYTPYISLHIYEIILIEYLATQDYLTSESISDIILVEMDGDGNPTSELDNEILRDEIIQTVYGKDISDFESVSDILLPSLHGANT